MLVERDQELKVLPAQLGGGVGRLGAQRDDDAPADEQGDGGDVDVVEGVRTAFAVDDLVRVPVVVVVLGEVHGHAGGPLFRHGGDHDAGAEEILQLERPRGLVLRVVEEDRRDAGGAVCGGALHGRVEVVEQAVADADGLAGGGGDGGPAVKLLAGGAGLVVVAVEAVKGAEGGPARAELLGGGAGEAAHVGADHVELEERGEGEHAADGLAVLLPRRGVVAEPVADLAARAGKGAAGDDELAEAGAAGEHGVVRKGGHLRAVEVVRVVHGQPVLVDHVRVDRVVGDAALVGVPVVLEGRLVVDGVLGVQEVAPGEALLVAGGGSAGGEDEGVGVGSRRDVGVGFVKQAAGDLVVQGAALLAAAAGLDLAWPAGDRARRCADGRRRRGEADGRAIGIVAGEVAREVARLIHVDPERINVQTRALVKEDLELVGPVRLRVLGEPVREDGDAGPDDAEPEGAVGAQEEGILLDATLQWRVVLVRNCRVDHDNVVLVVGVEVRDDSAHLVELEALRIKREDATAVHVVNVRPHGLKRDASGAVVVDNLGDLEDVLVAVAAVVVAKTPVRLHGRCTRQGAVLLDGIDGGRAGEEVKV